MDYSFYNKKKRKGFTLVELLVVIAILAVLAGVSVIGYLTFIKKAKVSNDISLTTQMNTVLNANKAADGKNDTPHDAVEDLIDGGLNVNKLTPTTNGYNYVYDLENDEMILLDESMNLVAPEHRTLRESKISYFVFIENENELTNNVYNGYSFYLKNEFTSDNSLEVSTGIDVGENSSITSITYKNSTKQTALIRTNGGTLNVNAPNDTINHYGWVKELDVTSVATSDCFHEHGYVGNLNTFTTGRFTCYEGSEFHQTEDEIREKLGDKGQDLPKGKYGEHHYDHGKCDIDDCSSPYDPKHVHTFGEWETKTDATCTEAGSKEHKCIECGYTDTETVAALGHSWNDGEVTKEATCKEAGTKTYTCSRCNATKTEEIAKNDSHTWDSGTETTAATCTITGVMEYKCDVCGETKTETIAALGHDYQYNKKDNTYHTVTCSRCSYSVEEAHQFNSDNKCLKCGCEKEEEVTEVTIEGVASWETEADHKDDNGNTIGRTDELTEKGFTILDNSGNFSDYGYGSIHIMTITYTIPAGTSANATITLVQPNSDAISRMIDKACPSSSFGITYKIINNSNNEYKISNTTFNSELVETIVDTENVIELADNKYICCLNDGTYKELSSDARPLITIKGPFEEYRKWLYNNNMTTCTSVTDSFIKEYNTTHSKSAKQKFMDFYNTLPDSSTDSSNTSTTKANVWEKMSGNGVGNPSNYRHVEVEVIKQMILFEQTHLIGYTFVNNIYKKEVSTDGKYGWYDVKNVTDLSLNDLDLWNYKTITDWNDVGENIPKVISGVELTKSENVPLVYNTNENVTTAGLSLLWHAYAGNAWQSTEICDFPSLTITMEKA